MVFFLRELFIRHRLIRWLRKCLEELKFCKGAEAAFASLPKAAHSVHVTLLRAHLHLDLRQTSEATRWLQHALQKTSSLQSTMLWAALYEAFGRLAEQKENLEDARNYYRLSTEYREKSSVHANAGELKVSYGRNSSDALHCLLGFHVTAGTTNAAECFELVEKIKSREMREMLGLRASTIPVNTKNRSVLVEQVKQSREQLSWYYREAGSVEFSNDKQAERKGEELQRLIAAAETSLLKSFESIKTTHEEFYSIQTGNTAPMDRVREALNPDEMLIEFFDVALRVRSPSREPLLFARI